MDVNKQMCPVSIIQSVILTENKKKHTTVSCHGMKGQWNWEPNDTGDPDGRKLRSSQSVVPGNVCEGVSGLPKAGEAFLCSQRVRKG